FAPIIAKALTKNPALRYGSMAEMARAVEAIGKTKPPPMPEVLPVAQPAPEPPPLTALPAVTWRGLVAEMCGALVLATILAALGTTLWAVPGEMKNLPDIAAFFFLTTAVCWGVLAPGKLWSGWGSSRGDGWVRRPIMLGVGALVGLGSLWLQGWFPRLPPAHLPAYLRNAPELSPLFPGGGWADVAAALSYFGLTFFALRWWRLTDPRRTSRF